MGEVERGGSAHFSVIPAKVVSQYDKTYIARQSRISKPRTHTRIACVFAKVSFLASLTSSL